MSTVPCAVFMVQQKGLVGVRAETSSHGFSRMLNNCPRLWSWLHNDNTEQVKGMGRGCVQLVCMHEPCITRESDHLNSQNEIN